MKHFVSVILIALISISAFTQDCSYYFNYESGTKLKYNMYDSKDKLSGSMAYEIKEIKEVGDELIATMKMTLMDKKSEFVNESEYEFKCKDGVMYIDFNSFMGNNPMMEAYEQMEVTVDGKDISLPANLRANTELEDGKISMAISMNGVQMMNMSVHIHDRKVHDKETVEVPAGKFETYKVSSSSTVKSVIEMTTKSVEWYSQEVGMIRSEMYDKSGKLESYTVLVSID
jgi:hypothetical protein